MVSTHQEVADVTLHTMPQSSGISDLLDINSNSLNEPLIDIYDRDNRE